jgi:ElaB/YqjD/DUF883 family membrane-anchored ribosome-binding protein
VSEYAGEMGDRVADKASAYASSMADYAEDARRRMGDYADEARRSFSSASQRASSQAQSAWQSASETLREQPLLIAAFGLAAGAAVAALFPTTEVERRTLKPAADAIADAAGEAGENLMQAANRAGERLQQGAAQRGLSPEGLKDLAREAAETFTGSGTGAAGTSGPAGSTGMPPRPATG